MELQNLLPGHPLLEPNTLLVTLEEVQDYLEAVGDTHSLYEKLGIIPPVALAARAIRELIIQLSLPPGSTHIAQEIESQAPCMSNVALTLKSQISQNSVRGKWRFLGITFEINQDESRTVLRGNSTVLVPVGVET